MMVARSSAMMLRARASSPGSDGMRGFDWVHDDDSFHRCSGNDRRNFAQLLFSGEKNDATAGILQNEFRLLGGEGGIDGDGDRPDELAGKVRGGPLRAVFAQDGDAVALGNSPGEQGLRNSGDVAVKLSRGSGYPATVLAV
jgi:hypothetical protein